MKICFFYNSAFTLGGIQRCMTVLANELLKHGHEISFICSNSKVKLDRNIYNLDERVKVIFTKKQNIIRKIINRSLQFIRKLNHRTGILKNNAKILNYTYYYYLGKQIQKIIDKQEFDILIGCGGICSKIISMINKKGLKKIGWQHSSYEIYFNYNNSVFKNEDASLKEMFENLDKYIVLTINDKEQLKKLKNIESQTIYNPVGFKQEKKSNLENKKFLALGRLDKIKGFDILINNFKKFNDKNKEWTLDIIGNGPERENLEKQIKDLDLEKYINLQSRKNNVQEIYKEASIYCMTSYKEGFPLVILEAMESGLPIIAYDMPCVREMFNNENNGIIIEDRNDNEYIQEMINLANDENRRKEISSNAIKRAEDFHIENITQQWLDVFEKLANI